MKENCKKRDYKKFWKFFTSHWKRKWKIEANNIDTKNEIKRNILPYTVRRRLTLPQSRRDHPVSYRQIPLHNPHPRPFWSLIQLKSNTRLYLVAREESAPHRITSISPLHHSSLLFLLVNSSFYSAPLSRDVERKIVEYDWVIEVEKEKEGV